jgi:hypothetical protein
MAHGLAGLSDLSVPMVVQSMRANDAQAGEKGMAVDNLPERPSDSLFDPGIPRMLLPRASRVKPTSAALRF